MFQNILVPFDFGDASQRALDLALELGRVHGARIKVLHVWEVPVYAYPGIEFSAVDLLAPLAEAGEERLTQLVREVKARYSDASGVFRIGSPSEQNPGRRGGHALRPRRHGNARTPGHPACRSRQRGREGRPAVQGSGAHGSRDGLVRIPLPGLRSEEQVTNGPAILTRGLTRRFGSLLAVDGLDLEMAEGTILGLLGSNGAGKSTTLKMLTTLLPPSEGTASVAGYDVVKQEQEVRRHIGYVPQMLSADAALTGRENLELSARLYGIPGGERRARIDDALAFMELSEVGPTLVRKYSGGMIRRLEIAQALLHRPEVLFLDEPTVGLDPNARQAVWDRLRDLRSSKGTTVLLTTHDMEEAEELCQIIALMHRGRLVAQGTPTELQAAVGPGASMTDVFVHHTGGTVEGGGDYRDVARTRRTASRLG